MKAEDINWEDAPEGTTHYNKYNGKWYKFEGQGKVGQFWDKKYSFWHMGSLITPSNYLIERPKEKEMRFKAMKIRVKDEEHSRLIQEALFEMGYEWKGFSKNKLKLDVNAFYIRTTKEGDIWYGGEYQYSAAEGEKYEAKIKVEFVEIQKPDTVELNGKTYLKSDLEEALAKLNPVEV